MMSQTAECQYKKYLHMNVHINAIDYSKFQFVSEFESRHHKKSSEENKILFEELASLLPYALKAKNYWIWEEILQIKKYQAFKPMIKNLPPEPQKPCTPKEPTYDDLPPELLKIPEKPIYSEVIFEKSFLKINNVDLICWIRKFFRDKLPKISCMIEAKMISINKMLHNRRMQKWKKQKNNIEDFKRSSEQYKPYIQALNDYEKRMINYQQAICIWEKEYNNAEKKLSEALSLWLCKKIEFENLARIEHEKLLKLKNNYEKKEKFAVEKVVKTILSRSPYPDSFPRHCDVNYDDESKIIILDFQLPDFERFEIGNDKWNFKPVAKHTRKSITESSLPAIAIRTLYEVSVTDEICALSSIVFNGWVNFIDKTNGNERYECILSVHAKKEDIEKLIITNLGPKECFKSFKGIVAKNILEYIPVAPILMINKKDNRIIEGREIIDGLSEDHNLAAMNWNDFEHLIRELFEKEFSQPGAEVRITHASHDRGVDAIIYDPDPIRGGKFVIQAKRYTKLVDVSAVRDLYGTIQNEGANKGILVTTSHYGPDAYDFAKGKNITLLTGGNLLHLLGKHGYRFKIDIKEARKLLNLK